jgi:four helix bundle protein
MTYEQWEISVAEGIRQDSLWRMKVYRLSLFLSDLTWHDCTKIAKDAKLVSTADQLYRACGRVGACIAEGYSKGTGRDRVRFYEYSLGSLREARHWYYTSRRKLTDEVLAHRMKLIAEMIRLLLTMISRDRKAGRLFEKG